MGSINKDTIKVAPQQLHKREAVVINAHGLHITSRHVHNQC